MRKRSPKSNDMQHWLQWLTKVRLSRWNHLRYRAGLKPVTLEQGAMLLFLCDPDVLEKVKARID